MFKLIKKYKLIILFSIIFLSFIFSNKSYAGAYNVDTSGFNYNVFSYIQNCTESVCNYFNSNNINIENFDKYFIGSNKSDGVIDFQDTSKDFFIAIGNGDIYISDSYKGSIECRGSNNLYIFYFQVGHSSIKDVYHFENKSNAYCNPISIYYTNFSSDKCSINNHPDFFNGAFKTTELEDENLKSITFNYDGVNYNLTNIPNISSNYIIQKWDYNGWFNILFLSDDVVKINYNHNNHLPVDKNGNTLGAIAYYRCNQNNTSYWYSVDANKTIDNSFLSNCCYLTVPVYKDGSLYMDKTDGSSKLPFHLEYNDVFNSYIVYSKWYDCIDNYSGENMYRNYFQSNPLKAPTSFNFEIRKSDSWISMEGENEIGPGLEFDCSDEYMDNITTKEELEGVKWRNGLQIIDYGTYYFCCYNYNSVEQKENYEIVKFVINENGNSYTETLDKNNYNTWINKTDIDTSIDNDLKDNINQQNSYDYFKIFYSEDYESAYIYTNWFLSDSQYNYVVDYSMDNVNFNDNVNIEEYTDVVDYFRYSINVYKNGTYYIRLRIYDNNTEHSLVSTKTMQVKIRSIGVTDYRSDYTDVEYRIKNNKVYIFLKANLGALFSPIDLLFNFFDRIDRIDSVQPTIVVPTVRDYFTNTVIINGFTYNLNSVLQNETFAEVYNIYLNFVDFTLFIAILCYLYKVLKEFINFGGGII